MIIVKIMVLVRVRIMVRASERIRVRVKGNADANGNSNGIMDWYLYLRMVVAMVAVLVGVRLIGTAKSVIRVRRTVIVILIVVIDGNYLLAVPNPFAISPKTRLLSFLAVPQKLGAPAMAFGARSQAKTMPQSDVRACMARYPRQRST